MHIIILSLALVGVSLITAGSFVLWGHGVALLVGGAFVLAAAFVAARGAVMNG